VFDRACNLGWLAQELAGDWQGTLQNDVPLRVVLKISKADAGTLNAKAYLIDEDPQAIPIDSIARDGSGVKFAIAQFQGSYEGKLSTDGNTITGMWTQNGGSKALNFVRATTETAWPTDATPHSVRFIPVEQNVKLEVLDWGGTGRPLVLLAGLGDTAHVFDRFALKLTPTYHVYGITRRGWGLSSAPTPVDGNYAADRLGDDVLAVLDALGLKRPILVGHSIAGEELSSVGSRRSERVAGLIYLDAGMPYAFYDSSRGDIQIDLAVLRRQLDRLTVPGTSSKEIKSIFEEVNNSLPQVQKDLETTLKHLRTMPDSPAQPASPQMIIAMAVVNSPQRYKYSLPCAGDLRRASQSWPDAGDPVAWEAARAEDLARTSAQADSFQAGVPTAHVVRIPNASHFIFLSKEADVLREMNAFIAKLPE
jgi:non-heme chloroperoxidase